MSSVRTMCMKSFQTRVTYHNGPTRNLCSVCFFFRARFVFFPAPISRVFAPASRKSIGSYRPQNLSTMRRVKTNLSQGTILHQAGIGRRPPGSVSEKSRSNFVMQPCHKPAIFAMRRFHRSPHASSSRASCFALLFCAVFQTFHSLRENSYFSWRRNQLQTF